MGNDRRFSISNSRNVRGTPFGSISGRRESLAGSLMTGLSYGGRLVESGFSPEE